MFSYKQYSFFYFIIVLILTISFLISVIYSIATYNSDFLFLSLTILVVILVLLKIIINLLRIKETTLCFVVKENHVLMMHRIKKKDDEHQGKWNGLGGKIDGLESPLEGIKREATEEAGITLNAPKYVGYVEFINFAGQLGKEMVYCYYADDFEGELAECDEGELHWIDRNEVLNRPLWQGDLLFIENIIDNKKFYAKLQYENDRVIDHKVEMVKRSLR